MAERERTAGDKLGDEIGDRIFENNDLHERLTDFLTRLEVTVRPVDGHAHIVAESMADAMLPFVREEIDNAIAAERERWMSLDPS